MSKRTRWSCPLCGETRLAPPRPRRDDVRRYCLACSRDTGRLVERQCAAREKKRAAAKARARVLRQRRYVFRAPTGYWVIAGIDIREHWVSLQSSSLGQRPRVRTTSKAGPVRVTARHVTFRRGVWADRFDVEAQLLVGVARAMLWPKAIDLRGREFVRQFVESHARVRPRLEKLSEAEIEVAALLRARDAVATLGESQPGRKRAVGYTG